MTDRAVPIGLPALDRDMLKLLFRNLLAQKAVKNNAGTYIIKLAATSRVCLAEVGHVTNRLRRSILTSHGMALKRDFRGPAIVVTAAQFAWLVQWGMFQPENVTIASRNSREWQSFVEYFKVPSLKTLKHAVPLHKPRKLADNSSMDLAADIISLSASSIRVLRDVPVWKFSEPLPALHLSEFTYSPRSWDDILSNLSGCVVDELTVFLDQGSPDDEVSLDILLGINVKKIVFDAGFTDLGELSAVEGATNEHVRQVGFELNKPSVDVQDIEVLHRFLPNLASIEIDADLHVLQKHAFADGRGRGHGGHLLSQLQQIGEYLASEPSTPSLRGLVTLNFSPDREREWTADSVLDEYEWVREARDAIAPVPPQVHVRASVDATFHRVGDAEAKKADDLARKLGFKPEPFVKPCGIGVAYVREVEVGPTRELQVRWAMCE